MTMLEDLHDCPFCGSKGPFDQYPCEWLDGTGHNVIRCAMCHGAAPMTTWNRRTHATQIEQDARDAERLDWMNKLIESGERVEFAIGLFGKGAAIGMRPKWLSECSGSNIRECIDAAMAKESGNG